MTHIRRPDGLDNLLAEIVAKAYEDGIMTSANYARRHAALIAMAASLGLITTRMSGDVFGKVWRPTVKGLRLVAEKELERIDD